MFTGTRTSNCLMQDASFSARSRGRKRPSRLLLGVTIAGFPPHPVMSPPIIAAPGENLTRPSPRIAHGGCHQRYSPRKNLWAAHGELVEPRLARTPSTISGRTGQENETALSSRVLPPKDKRSGEVWQKTPRPIRLRRTHTDCIGVRNNISKHDVGARRNTRGEACAERVRPRLTRGRLTPPSFCQIREVVVPITRD